MATKNLARTAVERGRTNRDTERYATRVERREVKALVRAVDPDAVPVPRRKQDWDSGLNENLKPLERFLQANAGRPWSKVYSELCKKYDRRTLQGNHILTDHIDRGMVSGHKAGAHYKFGNAWVDPHGILRYKQYKRWDRR